MLWSFFGMIQAGISPEKELKGMDPWSGAAWTILLMVLLGGMSLVNKMREQMVTKKSFDEAMKSMSEGLSKDIKIAAQEVERKLSEGLDSRFREFLSRRELDLSFTARDQQIASLSERLARIEHALEKS